jgi:hypothetical protein
MLVSSIKIPLRLAPLTICLIAFVSALAVHNSADCAVSVSTGDRPNQGGSEGSIAPSPVTSEIIGTNRFVVGFSFRNFDLKKISPYFSVKIQNSGNPSFHPRENHHVYSGIMLMGLGKLTHKRYLKTIGTVLIVDDLIEHVFDVDSALGFMANSIDHDAYVRITSLADGLFR